MRECSPPTTCHMTCVTCHMSCFLLLFFLQSGEAYRWRVCYQRGLPRLVLALVSGNGSLGGKEAAPGRILGEAWVNRKEEKRGIVIEKCSCQIQIMILPRQPDVID